MRIFQEATRLAMQKVPRGTVAAQSQAFGRIHREPLLYGLDGLLRYALAYRMHFGSPLADDSVLGPSWLRAAKGLRGLLNGDGAAAMEHDRSTDSKDNGALEDIFWAAMEAAGFGEEAS